MDDDIKLFFWAIICNVTAALLFIAALHATDIGQMIIRGASAGSVFTTGQMLIRAMR